MHSKDQFLWSNKSRVAHKTSVINDDQRTYEAEEGHCIHETHEAHETHDTRKNNKYILLYDDQLHSS